MVFKLSEFKSSLNNYGVAKTNTYEVIISPPSGLNFQFAVDTSVENLRQLALRCSSVQLPELDLLTLPYYSKVTGVAENRVIGLNQFKIIPMEFIVDADMKSVNFFQNWLQFIVNYYSSGSNFNAINGDQLPFEVSYINEYAGTIDINVYPGGMQGYPGEDGTNTTFQQYKLVKAFPVNMGNIQLRWDSTDATSVMVLPVGFTYSAIEVPKMNRGQNLDPISANNVALSGT
jgi:hypothetical protein